MKTKDISISLLQVRYCSTALSDLIYIALSDPAASSASTSDGNVLKFLQIFCRTCYEKEFAPVGGVLTDRGLV